MADLPDHFDVAARVTRVLDRLGVSHVIGGSLASAFAGEARSTIDVDLIAALEPPHVAPLVQALAPEFYVDEQAVRRAVDTRSSANVIHQASLIKVDLFVAGGTPLDAQQLARRRPVEPRDGFIAYVSTAEDILLQKLRWYEKGHGVSDRQWRDIISIVRTQGEALDRAYLRANAPILKVAGPLERALEEGS